MEGKDQTLKQEAGGGKGLSVSSSSLLAGHAPSDLITISSALPLKGSAASVTRVGMASETLKASILGGLC